MFKDYDTFEIEIGAETDKGYPVWIKSPDGEARGLLRLSANDFALADASAAIARRDVDGGYLIQLGDFLFSELLNNMEVLARYRASLGMARSQNRGLRVRLTISELALAVFPWEFLHDPDEDGFLAISAETALVRYLPVRGPVRPLTVDPPVRILVAIASPKKLDPLDIRGERKLIEDALVDLQAGRKIQLLVVEGATTAKVNDAMKSFRPHVFHFIGHGVNVDDQIFLALEDETGRARLINDREFSEIFANVQETRLVVLNACQSAVTSSTLPLVGLAPKLLQRQLSGVVAMQQPLTDRAALIFSRSFYRSIALGAPVDTAVSVARGDLYTELGSEQIDWGIPVLFLRAPDGRLFRVEEKAQASQSLEIPRPPEPQALPPDLGFVGREAIVARCEESLERFGSATITGMPGIGKSALAVHLAHRFKNQYKIFWHQCAVGEGLDPIIWKLAAFMAWHGNSGLWNTLQSALLTGSPPPPSALLVEYIVQNLQAQDYLLCLDEYQYLESSGQTDSTLSRFIARLRPLVLGGQLRMLVTADRAPSYHTVSAPIALSGLGEAECLALLESNALGVETDLARQLIAQTQGNPQLLLLAAQTVQRSPNPRRILARLGSAPSILDYIVRELDSQLSADEREKMRGAAILLGHPGSRWVIEAITQSADSLPILLQLTNRHLLETLEGEFDWEYHQHSALQTIYYQGLLSPSQRREMHLRGAEYYRLHEVNDYKAALHYYQAGDHLRAAQLLTKDIWEMISLGHPEPVLLLLDGLAPEKLPSPDWERVRIAQGFINTYLRRTDAALRAFEDAIAGLESQTALTDTGNLMGYAAWGMADLLEYAQPQDALVWLERGLSSQTSDDPILHAGLRIKLGGVHSALGDFQTAIQTIEAGLSLLGGRQHLLQVTGRENLGVCHYYRGELRQATALWEEALARSHQLRNLSRGPGLTLNLAVAYMTLGDWPTAIKRYGEAAELSRQWGNRNVETLGYLNLGILYTRQGRNSEAESHLSTALNLARQYAIDEWEGHALFSLADLRLRQEEVGEATTLLAEASRIIEANRHNYQRPELLRLQAQVYLASADMTQAYSLGEASVALAQELGMDLDVGVGQQVLGQILAAAGRVAEAVEILRASLALLAGKDSYTLACTQLALARLLEFSDPVEGAELEHQALVTFERLQVVR